MTNQGDRDTDTPRVERYVIDGTTGVLYKFTGERRKPREGEDYLIAPGVVGTAGADKGIWTEREEILRRPTWREGDDFLLVSSQPLSQLVSDWEAARSFGDPASGARAAALRSCAHALRELLGDG